MSWQEQYSLKWNNRLNSWERPDFLYNMSIERVIVMQEKNRPLSLSEGQVPYQVRADAFVAGDDLVVILSGGDKPHVGAVAVGIPRPSLENPQAVSATASVFAMIGHKEDELARRLALMLAATLQRNAVVTVGIHVDNISQEGISTIEENCSSIIMKLIEQLKVV